MVARIQPKKATKLKVLEWFKKNLQCSLKIEPSITTFLAQKPFAGTRLVSTKLKSEYKKLRLETLAKLKSENEEDKNRSSFSSNMMLINEDKYYGILWNKYRF